MGQPHPATGAEACQISELKVHSRRNRFSLDSAAMARLQEIAVLVQLETGTNIIKISGGKYRYQGLEGEPLIVLWIYGGKVINQKTGVTVTSTWSTLNGYNDLLTLEVLEPAMLCASFLDTNLEDNQGEVQLSIILI